MTRQELEGIYFLRKELKMWQKRYADLQADIAPPIKVLDDMPHGKGGNSSPTEIKAIKLEETAKAIEGKIAEIKLAILEAEQFIATIDNSFTRMIIEYRCCQCLSWKEIAYALGEGYSDETVRQHYHRFIKTIPEK